MGINRQIERFQNRKAYDEFSRAWHKEKNRQDRLISLGEKIDENKRITKKPNFKQWIYLVESHRQRVLESVKQKLNDEIPTLDWDEEVTTNGEQKLELQKVGE